MQVYGEEIEYADDLFGDSGPPPPAPVRRLSKKVKSASGDSSSTSPERNRRDDLDPERGGGGSGAGGAPSIGGPSGSSNPNGVTSLQSQQGQREKELQQIQGISSAPQADLRVQGGQDHWHHKAASTVFGRPYYGSDLAKGPMAMKLGSKRFGRAGPLHHPTPNPLLKYLKVKVSNVKYEVFLHFKTSVFKQFGTEKGFHNKPQETKCTMGGTVVMNS